MHKFLDSGWLDQVPEGWKPVFLSACDAVAELLKYFNVEEEDFSFIGIKEKYGSLRVQYCFPNTTDEFDAVSNAVGKVFESLRITTSKLCVKCGEQATHISNGWILPFCEKCARISNNEANARHKTNFGFEECFDRI